MNRMRVARYVWSVIKEYLDNSQSTDWTMKNRDKHAAVAEALRIRHEHRSQQQE